MTRPAASTMTRSATSCRAELDLNAAATAAQGTFSYIATSGILSNTGRQAARFVLSVNGAIPVLFGKRCRDLAHTAYRLAANGELEGDRGLAARSAPPTSRSSCSAQAKTWGKMLTLTRTDMINDDLGASASRASWAARQR